MSVLFVLWFLVVVLGQNGYCEGGSAQQIQPISCCCPAMLWYQKWLFAGVETGAWDADQTGKTQIMSHGTHVEQGRQGDAPIKSFLHYHICCCCR